MFAQILETMDLQHTMMKKQQENIYDLSKAVQDINELVITAEEISRGHLNEFGTPGIAPFFILIGVSVSGESHFLTSVSRRIEECEREREPAGNRERGSESLRLRGGERVTRTSKEKGAGGWREKEREAGWGGGGGGGGREKVCVRERAWKRERVWFCPYVN
jgi:hypothetical protein